MMFGMMKVKLARLGILIPRTLFKARSRLNAEKYADKHAATAGHPPLIQSAGRIKNRVSDSKMAAYLWNGGMKSKVKPVKSTAKPMSAISMIARLLRLSSSTAL